MAMLEELRGLLRCFIIGETDRHDVPLVLSQLDSALAAAEARGEAKGCAEGAERERERIREGGQMVGVESDHINSMQGEMRHESLQEYDRLG